MIKHIHTWFVIGLYAFVPWVTVLFVLHLIARFPRLLFVGLHYVLVCLLFGYIFSHYFQVYPGSQPFDTTGIALVCVFVFEYILAIVSNNNFVITYSYVDWIVPMFLVSSAIYAAGKIAVHQKTTR